MELLGEGEKNGTILQYAEINVTLGGEVKLTEHLGDSEILT